MLNFISIRRRTMMVLFTANICGLSLLAEPPTRPPEGFARPPFHLKLDDSLLPLVTPGPTGLSPAAVRHFYGFDLITNLGAGQVIGIVTAYDDPNVEADLGVFNSNFKLATCTTSNGCFKKIYATGVKPATDATWALEAALDVQWAHAIAPQAKIYLVEAASNSVTDLLAGVDVAVKNGATVVSMSFGGAEFLTETNNDFHFTTAKVTFVAAAGDSGYGAEYTYELMASYQSGLPVPNANGYRAIPDVAYDANPSSGFAMYDSVAYQGSTGWFQVGGTSAGTPQWAALAAIVNSMRVAAKKQVLGATTTSTINNLLYLLGQPASYPNDYHDIKSGTNGTCGTICTSVAGYDYVTGLGSPKANALINALVAQP
jgi:subtilase family serine protease